MVKKYVISINEMEKALVEHAVQVLVDNQNEMGAITPTMADDLEKIVRKIEERGEYAVGI